MLKKAALAGASLLCLAHYAQAQNFDQLIAFGDSTTDTGWFANASPGLPGTIGAAAFDPVIKNSLDKGGEAHFTGPGPGNAQILGSFFGLPANPANTPGGTGTNYAIGGAFNDATLGLGKENLFSTFTLSFLGPLFGSPNLTLPGTARQINNYLASVKGHANPNALYLISSGGNNAIYASMTFGPNAAAANGFLLPEAQALANAVAQLQQAGAHYIIVSNQYLPPSATEDPNTVAYGLTLRDATFADLARAGVKFIFANTFAVIAAVEQDPMAFGITAPISSNACSFPLSAMFRELRTGYGVVCANTTTPPPPPQTLEDVSKQYGYLVSADATRTHLFVDGTHLSEAGQIIVADYYHSLLTQRWDGTTTVGDGPVNNANLTANGGNGTWNNSPDNTNWATSIGTVNSAWNGISAVFGGAPGTVTVADPIAYQSVQFSTGGYLLAASAGGTLMPTGVAPIIVDGGLAATIAAPITGSGGMDKDGLGTLTLTGADTYTGPTTIHEGAISVTGSLVSPVTVNSSGTLGGSGTVTGAVTINDMGTLAPGTPRMPGAPGVPSTLNVGPLTLENGSILSYLLGTPNVVGGATNDLTNVDGALTANGGTLFVTNSAAFGPGTYRLIDFTGALGGLGQIVVGTLPDGDTGVINTATSGQVNLIVSEAPATTQFWDGTNMVAGGIADGRGGDGTWNNTATNWTSATGLTNSAWQGISAVFAGAPGTVTVAEPIAYQRMQFSTGGYLLTASGGGTLVPSGVAPIIVDGGLAATIAAPITGSGGMDKNGLGTLTLTGDDTYSGGTTISFGTLQLGNGGTSGSIVGDVTNNGTLVFNRSDNVTFGGAIAGDGELTQLGPGTLVLTGNSPYTGPTNIDGGALQVNGSIAGSSLTTVNTGTMLFGTGTVGNAQVDSGALFAPGNGTPGTSMTVAGNLAFQSGAAYMVFLNASTSSFANVTGTASLSGTVNAVFAPGNSVAKQYLILQSAGLGATIFSDLTTTNLPADFIPSLSYSTDDAFLDLTAALGSPTLNVNQQNDATAINNFFNSGGTLPPGFVNVFNLTGANLSNALTQLSGENATGAERSAFALTNEFLSLMFDPYVATSGFAPAQPASPPPAVFKAPNPTFEQRWTAWAAGFGGGGTANGNPAVGSNNVTTSTFGYAAGMDYHYSPDTVLGFALAGGGTGWGLAQGLGGGRSDAFLAGIYGITHQGPVYLAGALAFANNWFTTARTALGEPLNASFQGQDYAARLEGGYRFAVPVAYDTIGITPYAAIQAQDFHTPAYSETDVTAGGFGLSYDARNGTDTRSELGGRFDDSTTVNAMPLVLRAKAAWAHDWVSNPALNASFESLPGSSFTVTGAPIPHDSALASASAQLFFAPNWSLLAKFDGEFASGTQIYAGSGTLRYTW